MADVTYSVLVDYIQNGSFNAPIAGLEKVQGHTEKWNKSLLSGASSFASSFNGALDTVGSAVVGFGGEAISALAKVATVGFGLLTHTAFSFNEELETTQIALAAIGNANGLVENMQGGMRIAGDIIKEMRLDAARLPGEFKDLEGIMATIASAGAQMGVGEWGMEKVSAKLMTAAEIMKVPMATAGRELAMILEGAARHSMPLFNRLGLGVSTKELNAMDPRKRFDLVTGALDRLNGDPNDPSSAMSRYANSWKGIKSTAVDNLRQSIGFLGTPVFNSVKGLVQEFNRFGSGNKDEIRKWGEGIADGIDHAFLRGVDGVRHWYPVVRDFSKDMYEHLHNGWMRIAPLIERSFQRLETFMKDPAAWDRMEKVVGSLLALRAGGWGLQHGASLGGSLLSGYGAMSGGGSAGAAAMAEAFPIVAAAAAAAAFALYGVVSALGDDGSSFHVPVTNAVKRLTDDVSILSNEMSKTDGFFKTFSQALGLFVVTELDGIVITLQAATWWLNQWTETIQNSISFFTGPRPKLTPDDPADLSTPFEYRASVKAMDTYAEKEKDRKLNPHITNIHNLHINVNSNQDPFRIAKRTADIITDLARHPKVAALTGLPQWNR